MDLSIRPKPEKPVLRPILRGEYRGGWLCRSRKGNIGYVGQTASAAYFGWLVNDKNEAPPRKS